MLLEGVGPSHDASAPEAGLAVEGEGAVLVPAYVHELLHKEARGDAAVLELEVLNLDANLGEGPRQGVHQLAFPTEVQTEDPLDILTDEVRRKAVLPKLGHLCLGFDCGRWSLAGLRVHCRRRLGHGRRRLPGAGPALFHVVIGCIQQPREPRVVRRELRVAHAEHLPGDQPRGVELAPEQLPGSEVESPVVFQPAQVARGLEARQAVEHGDR
mmetsp:Transcript_31909/g.91558  ORF Transcript_31909/g.91558 Transcript_31909/m.91558 type:complete len:213 (-) Transcript_31909:529-1167(-)